MKSVVENKENDFNRNGNMDYINGLSNNIRLKCKLFKMPTGKELPYTLKDSVIKSKFGLFIICIF